jgi:hypothetical protein
MEVHKHEYGSERESKNEIGTKKKETETKGDR